VVDEDYGSHPDYGWPTVLDACETMRLVIAIGTSFSVGARSVTEAGRRGILFVSIRRFLDRRRASSGARQGGGAAAAGLRCGRPA
jgi:hypothetical protein